MSWWLFTSTPWFSGAFTLSTTDSLQGLKRRIFPEMDHDNDSWYDPVVDVLASSLVVAPKNVSVVTFDQISIILSRKLLLLTWKGTNLCSGFGKSFFQQTLLLYCDSLEDVRMLTVVCWGCCLNLCVIKWKIPALQSDVLSRHSRSPPHHCCTAADVLALSPAQHPSAAPPTATQSITHH